MKVKFFEVFNELHKPLKGERELAEKIKGA